MAEGKGKAEGTKRPPTDSCAGCESYGCVTVELAVRVGGVVLFVEFNLVVLTGVTCKRQQELLTIMFRGTQRQFSENICSEDDLRSKIFGTFVVKFLACLPLLGFSNIY